VKIVVEMAGGARLCEVPERVASRSIGWKEGEKITSEEEQEEEEEGKKNAWKKPRKW